MPLDTSYVSKTPGPDGLYTYTDEENAVWHDLFTRQMRNLQDFACHAYLHGQDTLGFTAHAVPQVAEVHKRLKKITGAGVKPVAALIPQDEFSTLLKNRHFPDATFIRRREHIDYIEEPDIFHEVFGHCPMLTNDDICAFFEKFGTLALSLPEEDLPYLFRLFWFTVEFGLIDEDGQTKAFGAGIMSSPSEAKHAASDNAEVLPFDLTTILRTPYRIDIVQPVYFRLESFTQLANSLDTDIAAEIAKARIAGDLPPRFEPAS